MNIFLDPQFDLNNLIKTSYNLLIHLKRSFKVKFVLSMLIGLGLAVSAQAAQEKRKVAQEKVTCVPLGIPFNVFNEGESSTYTAEELKMLRNSIYAQLGFKFKDAKVTEEMTKRGCLKTDRTYSSDSLQKVDKQNISLLKSMENSLREDDAMADFQGSWDKAAKSAKTRSKMLTGQYCYLHDSGGKYFGILYFNDAKSVSGMMNLNKPSWADFLSAEERSSYMNSVAYKELDTTSAGFLDYTTKGSWTVGADGNVLLTINADKKAIKGGVIKVTAPNFKSQRMLECQLAK